MQETFTKRATGNAGFEAYYKVGAQAGRMPLLYFANQT